MWTCSTILEAVMQQPRATASLCYELTPQGSSPGWHVVAKRQVWVQESTAGIVVVVLAERRRDVKA
eukprot:356187-Chlamydomonas_euryale.AAC.4